MEINIDKEIDAHRCPTVCFCTVATTCYDPVEREHMCYKCWLAYCKEHNIKIIRLGLLMSDDEAKNNFLSGPYHPRFRELI